MIGDGASSNNRVRAYNQLAALPHCHVLPLFCQGHVINLSNHGQLLVVESVDGPGALCAVDAEPPDAADAGALGGGDGGRGRGAGRGRGKAEAKAKGRVP
eukprot:8707971-Alexandrium_andersonii.AAC.1